MELFDPWHYWIILGILLFALETVVPGFVLGCLGIGALGTIFIALAGVSVQGQLIGFAVISLISFLGIRPFILKYLNRGPQLTTNIDNLIGKTAEVTKLFDTNTKKGRVKIDGDDWLAYTVESIKLHKHDLVKILKVDSNTLIVEPISKEDKN